MPQHNLIDTFSEFLTFWQNAQQKPIDTQIDSWASGYMRRWPELLEKQQEDYASQGEDWRRVAREKVFPFLGQRLPAMQMAHDNLLKVCAPTYSKAREVLGFESDVSFVIYVGIGCGAGWVTTYQGLPAILFGLENIAEEGWSQLSTLTGLVSHEIGHVVHFHWLAAGGLPTGSGPWWQLYTEGFAQRCEHLILGQETWHMSFSAAGGSEDDWINWCQGHAGWLAGEFLRMVDSGESIRPFFGSWYDIRGRKQCGYFLGHELIRQLEARLSLKEIALLSDVDVTLRHELQAMQSDLGG
jgi:hypothetical protein